MLSQIMKTPSHQTAVVEDERPLFCGVSHLLVESTERTKDLLEKELDLAKNQLLEKLHMASLELIFIEHKIYRKIENAETWEDVVKIIHRGLKPHVKDLYREVSDE